MAATIASYGLVGADARWLAALGGFIVQERGIPTGLPYALAPSAGWDNVPVLAELVMHGLYQAAGDAGLLWAHVVAACSGLALLARSARCDGAAGGAVAACLTLTVLGASSTYFVVRLQLFSLLLFPALLWLLAGQQRRPDGRIWLLIPLLALWSNLHGAAVVGLAVAGAYLLLARLRQEPRVAVPVLVLSVLALSATPALEDTWSYYLGVAQNESAQLHVGLWARLSPTEPMDIGLVVALLVLLLVGRRYRPAPWEAVAVLGLLVLTLQAARNGVWLLLFVVPRVAQAWPRRSRQRLPVLAPAVALSALALLAAALVKGPQPTGASAGLVQRAAGLSQGCVLYADGVRAEQVVAQGGRVWITNPIDAFPADEQRRYLNWLESGETSLLPEPVRAVLVADGSPADRDLRGDPRYRAVSRDRSGVLHARDGC